MDSASPPTGPRPEPFSWANANLMPSWRAYFHVAPGRAALLTAAVAAVGAARAGAASAWARENAFSAIRAPSVQYSHIASRINACTDEHVKLRGRSARKTDLPVPGPGSGGRCPARKLEAMTAERLADMTGQPAPANNPVLGYRCKCSVAKLQHRVVLGRSEVGIER